MATDNKLNNLNDPNKISVYNAKGKFGTIDINDWEDAQSRGYSLAPEEVITDERNKIEQDSIGNEALAGLAGAARGLTFGISDQLLTKTDLVDPETLRKFREYSPTASIGGEIVGAIAPILLSGGAGAVAKGASLAPTALLARGTLATEQAVAGGLTRGIRALTSAAEGGSKLASTAIGKGLSKKLVQEAMQQAPKVASQAMEGAIYGAGMAVTEDALGERELNAESLLSSMGTGALFGAAIPAIVSPSLQVTAHGAKKAGTALKKVATNIEEAIIGNVKGAGSVAVETGVDKAAGIAGFVAAMPVGDAIAPGLGTIAGLATGGAAAIAAEAGLRSPAVRETFKKGIVKPAAKGVGTAVKGFSAAATGTRLGTVEKGVGKAFTPEGKAAREFIQQSGEEWDRFATETSDTLMESIEEAQKLSNSLDDKFDDIYGKDPVIFEAEMAGQSQRIEDASVLSNALNDVIDVIQKSPDTDILNPVREDIRNLTTDYFNELINAHIKPDKYYIGLRPLKGASQVIVEPSFTKPLPGQLHRFQGLTRALGAQQTATVGKRIAGAIGKKGVQAGVKAAEGAVEAASLPLKLSFLDKTNLSSVAKKEVKKWIKGTGQSVEDYIDFLSKQNPSINQKYVKRLHKVVRNAESDLTKAHGFSSVEQDLAAYPKLKWMRDNPINWKKVYDRFDINVRRDNLITQFYPGIDGKWLDDAWVAEAMSDKHIMQNFFQANSDKTFINVARNISADDAGLDDFVQQAGGWKNVVVKHKRGVGGKISEDRTKKGIYLDWTKASDAEKKSVQDNLSDWFVEEKLDLVDEFRVVTIGDKPVFTKHRWGSPGVKKFTDTTKLPSIENAVNVSDDTLRARVNDFAEKVSAETGLLTTGMDIGLTRDGELFLIELQEHYSPGMDFTPTLNSMKKAFNETLGDPRFATQPEATTVQLLRDQLNDNKYYGELGTEWNNIAVAQRDFKQARIDLIKQFRDVNPEIELSDTLFNADTPLSPDRIKGWLSSIGADKSAKTARQTDAIKNYLEKSNDLMEISNFVDKTKAVQSATDFTKYVNKLDDVKARNELNNFQQKNPMLHELGFLALAHTIGGPIGLGLAGIGRGVANPALASKALYVVEKGVTFIKGKVDKGIINAITSPVVKAGETVSKTGKAMPVSVLTPTTAITGLNWSSRNEKTEQELQDMYKEKISDINELVNSGAAIERVSNSTAGLTTFAPNISASLQEKALLGLNYLKNKAPVNPYEGTLLEDNLNPSNSEIAKWVRISRVVENPLSILDDITTGIPVEAVDALREVYPHLYTQIVEGFLDKTDEIKKLPYQQQLQINMFLGMMDTQPLLPKQSQEEKKTLGRKIKVNTTEGMSSDVNRVESK